MIPIPESNLHLTYCLNVHPGEDLESVLKNIKEFAAPIGRRLITSGPFGIGLRLSMEAADSLQDISSLHRFKKILETENLYVFTINGFPAGRFSGPGVKENVYLPDWTDPDRLDYSIKLGKILSDLLPADQSFGSISTLPGGFKARLKDPETSRTIARNLAICASEYHRIYEKTGKQIILALEPEPLCFLETTDETVDFFKNFIQDGPGLEQFCSVTGLDRDRGREAFGNHLGVCFDTCHGAVEFEDPEESLEALTQAGIRIAKIQISSALQVNPVEFINHRGGQTAAAYLDPVFLHQVTAKTGSTLERYPDLDQAINSLKSGSPGDQERGDSTLWRIHFHVPLFFPGEGVVGTTRDSAEKSIRFLCKRFDPGSPGFPHLEVETYTWDVLPEGLRGKQIHDDIVREINWVLTILEDSL